MTDNYKHIRTYDYGASYRLDRDFPPITTIELSETLRHFKQKAPGPTSITTLQLKNLPPNMFQYLLYIFNQYISAGYFPDSLKHARMIFIPKGNKSQYNTKKYRPISLLDIHGKQLEKILTNRLTRQLEINGHTNDRQHGFRKNRGTHTALAIFHETTSNAINSKHAVDIVLRNVEKAFDKVWHTGLIFKILNLGLHTCFTRIRCDYLTDRTATIQIKEYIGLSFQLHSGVPQGHAYHQLYIAFTHMIC